MKLVVVVALLVGLAVPARADEGRSLESVIGVQPAARYALVKKGPVQLRLGGPRRGKARLREPVEVDVLTETGGMVCIRDNSSEVQLAVWVPPSALELVLIEAADVLVGEGGVLAHLPVGAPIQRGRRGAIRFDNGELAISGQLDSPRLGRIYDAPAASPEPPAALDAALPPGTTLRDAPGGKVFARVVGDRVLFG